MARALIFQFLIIIRYAVSKLFPTSRLQTPREGIHRYISYLTNTLHVQEENYHEDR